MLSDLPSIRFVPTAVPTLAALCALCVMVYLGSWQQQRAAEKRALQAEFEMRAKAAPLALGASIVDPVASRYARATARGEWVANGQIYVDNKFDNDAVGFHVVAPLRIAGTDRYVLVNRGWVARGVNYPSPPVVTLPGGPVTVEGVLTVPTSRFLELAPATTQGRVWQNLTIERFRASSGLDVLPLVLLASTAAAPLKPVSERPDARAEKHVEYMLTWYSLAATVVVLWAALNLKFDRKPSHEGHAGRGDER